MPDLIRYKFKNVRHKCPTYLGLCKDFRLPKRGCDMGSLKPYPAFLRLACKPCACVKNG